MLMSVFLYENSNEYNEESDAYFFIVGVQYG
jgi:hypothetical protein